MFVWYSMHHLILRIDRRVYGERPDGHPCHKVLPIDVEKEKGLRVEITQCAPLINSMGYSLIRLVDMDGTHPDIADKVNSYKNEHGEATAVKISKSQSMVMVLNNNCNLASIVSESGCFLLSAIPQDDNIIDWRVLAPNKVVMNKLINRMRTEGYGVEKISSYNVEVESALTSKQEEYVHLAYNMGYYDVPRKISLEDLAEMANCSKSTLSVSLRDAERRLVVRHAVNSLDVMKQR